MNLKFCKRRCISFLLTYCLSFSSFAQDSICDFKTDGSGKSKGLKIKLAIPCSWEEREGERPHVVRKFTYTLSDTASALINLTITPDSQVISKKEANECFIESGLKEIASSFGTYISGRKIKIDGNDAGEIIVKSERILPLGHAHMYSICYFFYYKNLYVVLMYAINSLSEVKSKTYFDKNIFLFKALATKTVILSK